MISSRRGHHPRTVARPLGSFFALMALMGSVAACSDDSTPTASSPEASESQTKDAQGSAYSSEPHTSATKPSRKAAAPNPTPGAQQPAKKEPQKSGSDCAVKKGAPEIVNNVDKIPPNQFGWKVTDETNYNHCSDLSYALIMQAEIGNSQFGTQLMLFHKGEFLGVGSDTIQQTQVLSTTNNSVTVRMRDWETLYNLGKGHAEAPDYYSDVTFRWVGDHVEPEGRIPNQELSHRD